MKNKNPYFIDPKELSLGLEPVLDFKKMLIEAEIKRGEKIFQAPVALSIGNHFYKGTQYPTPFGTYGNFSCIVGASKSMKTFLKSAITAAYIGGNTQNLFPNVRGHNIKDKWVIDIDTEQSRFIVGSTID